MSTYALRGASSLQSDTPEQMDEVVVELITQMMVENSISAENIVSIIFTGTPDIHSKFPATSLRGLGFSDTPLLCAQEMDVNNALPLTVRALIYVDSPGDLVELKRQAKHQYLRNAAQLRPDLPKTVN